MPLSATHTQSELTSLTTFLPLCCRVCSSDSENAATVLGTLWPNLLKVRKRHTPKSCDWSDIHSISLSRYFERLHFHNSAFLHSSVLNWFTKNGASVSFDVHMAAVKTADILKM